MSTARREPLAIDVSGPEDAGNGGRAGRLLFVHGSLDTGRSFNELRQALSDDAGATDWQIVSYDRRGYGASLPTPSPSSGEPFSIPRLDDQLTDLEDLAGDGDCVLFGHSLGGVLALTVAARRPDLVRGVICYEAPMPWLPT